MSGSSGRPAPLVSVILPTYRRGHLIARALRSVLTQSHRELEVIVLDDVPGDDTEAVVKGFGDSRVRYVSHPDRRGVAAARNQGLALARGELIAFQDSDDEWLTDKLAHQVARLRSLPDDVAVTQGAVLRVEGDHVDYLVTDLPKNSQLIAILRCNWTTFLQAALIRRAALTSIGGFDEALPLWEDWELMIRLARQHRIDVDSRPMAVIFDTPGGLTAQDAKRVSAFRWILEKHAALMQNERAILAHNLYTLARLELVYGDPREGRALAWRSARLDPRDLKAWALLFFSFGGAGAVRAVAHLRRQRRLAA